MRPFERRNSRLWCVVIVVDAVGVVNALGVGATWAQEAPTVASAIPPSPARVPSSLVPRDAEAELHQV